MYTYVHHTHTPQSMPSHHHRTYLGQIGLLLRLVQVLVHGRENLPVTVRWCSVRVCS